MTNRTYWSYQSYPTYSDTVAVLTHRHPKEQSVPKQLLFDDQARLKLQRGVKQLADVVAVTMGPTGRNVIIDKNFGNPVVTKDGVTVSKEVELDDPYENMGAK